MSSQKMIGNRQKKTDLNQRDYANGLYSLRGIKHWRVTGNHLHADTWALRRTAGNSHSQEAPGVTVVFANGV